ncbi:MAG TPA: sulfatase [Solirubrobacterales bacterium]|jgi:arylsulfatase A-like enzyme|nr:sulfatase [Solirubrobacterales bacterium]
MSPSPYSARSRAVGVAGVLVLFATILAALAALPAGAPPAHAAPKAKEPNIVVITTDDQTLASLRPDTMPNVFRQIAAKGTTFTNAIVTTPLCCPSRATWLTGQYAHNHGVTSNRLAYAALEEKINTLPAWLHRAGYKTAHVGKYLNGYEGAVGDPREVAPGWDLWYTMLGSTRYYSYDVAANGRQIHFGQRNDDYVTRVINHRAATWAGRLTRGNKPLYLQVDHRTPHTETGIETRGGCQGRTVPDPDDKQLFKSEPLPQPPSLNEADISDKPSFLQSRPPLDLNKFKKLAKRYTCGLAALRSVDRGVGEIVEKLKKSGELGNTVIAFTSDNGYYQGEHRIAVGKIYPYEEGIRVPFVVRVPPRYLGGASRIPEVSAPVANIDLAPTILDLAGATACRRAGKCRVMDGRSLVGLLSGSPGFPADRALLTEYDVGNEGNGEDGLCRYTGVRVPGAIYVEHTLASDPANGCDPTPERELYDLIADPFELENLDGSADGLEATLSERLQRLRDCAGIAGREPHVEGRPPCE